MSKSSGSLPNIRKLPEGLPTALLLHPCLILFDNANRTLSDQTVIPVLRYVYTYSWAARCDTSTKDTPATEMSLCFYVGIRNQHDILTTRFSTAGIRKNEEAKVDIS